MTAYDADDGEILATTLFNAWSKTERILNGSLGSIRGITYSEYRLLSSIATGPDAGSSRVDLARSVGLSPSAVTRALRPLGELGMVTTTKHPRDARLAIAQLTPAGEELVSDAAGVVRDSMIQVAKKTNLVNQGRPELLAMLDELAQL